MLWNIIIICCVICFVLSLVLIEVIYPDNLTFTSDTSGCCEVKTNTSIHEKFSSHENRIRLSRNRNRK